MNHLLPTLSLADFPTLPRVPGQRIAVVVSLPADWEEQDAAEMKRTGNWTHHDALFGAACEAYPGLDFDDFETDTVARDADIPGNILVEFSADAYDVED